MLLGAWRRRRRFRMPPLLTRYAKKSIYRISASECPAAVPSVVLDRIGAGRPQAAAGAGAAVRRPRVEGSTGRRISTRGETASRELSGIHELRVDDAAGTFRAVYVHRFESFIYVLHVFQKKSTHGHAMSKRDVDLIRQRLAQAKADDAAHLRDQGDRA